MKCMDWFVYTIVCGKLISVQLPKQREAVRQAEHQSNENSREVILRSLSLAFRQ